VYTHIVEVILGVPFGYEPSGEARKLLEDFRDMVNFCIDYAYRRRITSYAKLRKGLEDFTKSGRSIGATRRVSAVVNSSKIDRLKWT